MASFKLMSSSNSDLSRRNSSSASSSPSIRSSHHLRPNPHADHSRISFAYGGGVNDYTFASDSKPFEMAIDVDRSIGDRNSVNNGKSVDDVWKEIVSGEQKTIMMKEEEPEDIMTLEDFLAKAEMDEGASDEIDVKIPTERLNNDGSYTFDFPMQRHSSFQMVEGSMGGGVTRGKRGRVMMEAMDKAAAQRQKRMIKNRESAARSRERKQAYQVELETLAAKLEEENEQLLKEIEESTKERYKKLMEVLIPVDEKPRPPSRPLSRSHSLEW
ncbi:G-box-binding factor 4 [Arabidopsis thaliana]|uniref:G-box-binding factor 4 n=4 Tax=Arabidopsis TaxID=3701 RepID=GBF4_ARATH|nr:G-box binding factor 4 [Arabidopsis thaliana]P42777.1 RecName: Full=G-box-binding factor 4; AltName: Full=bZIP transcription factor 40; Short=AtbZIP40 [Arabidopsis thaliana]KAG7645000.1 Basic-leucine zipper domain [Arabidopsis thaliana x Arabidopsis arenosa]AAA18414.1 GBF4 [Arabidopsis thaliana]AAD10673.1 GBF4 [Arabidopsis thaliana]AAM65145.1 G-box binding factor, GBF4 [Arabidopsis thaliana]ABD19676.1 At1g03970 [Arabidopsis thaliana]|eukprot:NP_171893.1 G-box binding factor 4 [Arabidopsis thaliana]